MNWILRSLFITGTRNWIDRVLIWTTISLFHLYGWKLSNLWVPTIWLFHLERYFLEIDFLLVKDFNGFCSFWSYAIEFGSRLLWRVFVPYLLNLRQWLQHSRVLSEYWQPWICNLGMALRAHWVSWSNYGGSFA